MPRRITSEDDRSVEMSVAKVEKSVVTVDVPNIFFLFNFSLSHLLKAFCGFGFVIRPRCRYRWERLWCYRA